MTMMCNSTDSKKKTIMILGAGRGQVGLYKAARELGHRSVAVSIPGDYPGFAFADEIEHGCGFSH